MDRWTDKVVKWETKSEKQADRARRRNSCAKRNSPSPNGLVRRRSVDDGQDQFKSSGSRGKSSSIIDVMNLGSGTPLLCCLPESYCRV